MYLILTLIILFGILGWFLNDLLTDDKINLPIINKPMPENSEQRHDWGWLNSYCLKKFYVKETDVIILKPRCEF